VLFFLFSCLAYADRTDLLRQAAGQGNAEKVAEALHAGVNVDSRFYSECTALMYAAMNGHKEVVVLLLDNNACINAKNGEALTALTYAALNGHKEVVRLLLQKGASTRAEDNDNMTLLMIYSLCGMLEEVASLLPTLSDVNARDNGGDTALIHAARSGQQEVVALLLDKNANVNAKNKYGATALMHAAAKGHKEVVALLLDKNANVNVKDKYGSTPLMLATGGKHKEVVQLLLDRNANVNAMGKYGNTALKIAAQYNHKDLVQFLLDKNANVDQDEDNLTALRMLADMENHEEVMKILISRGAAVNKLPQEQVHKLMREIYQEGRENIVYEVALAYLEASKNIAHLDTVAAIYAWQGQREDAEEWAAKAQLATPVRVHLLLQGLAPQKTETLLNIQEPYAHLLAISYYRRQNRENQVELLIGLANSKNGEAFGWKILDCYLGTLSLEELFALANLEGTDRSLRLCHFFYYIALDFLAKGDSDKAKEYLQNCVAQKVTEAVETELAANELQALLEARQ
jgi:ankyrin repeat protein